MGIFGDQAERLLRESWTNPSELAEELYSIFTSDQPVQVTSGLQVANQPGSLTPPLQVSNLGNTNTVLQFVTSPEPVPSFGDIPPFPPLDVSLGNIQVTGFAPDGTASTAGGPRNKPLPPSEKKSGGGGIPGQVVSGGPGQGPYTVAIYPDGTGGASQEVQVTQLQIDPAATIPAGAWTIVTQAGSNYYMQYPVWGPDLP